MSTILNSMNNLKILAHPSLLVLTGSLSLGSLRCLNCLMDDLSQVLTWPPPPSFGPAACISSPTSRSPSKKTSTGLPLRIEASLWASTTTVPVQHSPEACASRSDCTSCRKELKNWRSGVIAFYRVCTRGWTDVELLLNGYVGEIHICYNGLMPDVLCREIPI